MVIKVYISRLAGNVHMKTKQTKIVDILTAKNIEHEEVDISDTNIPETKTFMQQYAKAKEGQIHPLPPQVFNGDDYCGGYEEFEDAVENNQIYEFLKMAPAKQQSEAKITVTSMNKE